MLDLSDRPELRTLALVVRALREEGGARECLLVGAMARDIQLAFQHGISVTRATKDLDFAVAVPDWPTFLRMREALLASTHFQVRGKALHALTFMATTPVDLIPFGGVLRSDQSIACGLTARARIPGPATSS